MVAWFWEILDGYSQAQFARLFWKFTGWGRIPPVKGFPGAILGGVPRLTVGVRPLGSVGLLFTPKRIDLPRVESREVLAALLAERA